MAKKLYPFEQKQKNFFQQMFQSNEAPAEPVELKAPKKTESLEAEPADAEPKMSEEGGGEETTSETTTGAETSSVEAEKDEVQKLADVFRSRLEIPENIDLKNKERYIVDGFTRTNLRNIVWYNKHIWKEQRKLNWYYAFTLVLLLGVPVFIYLCTANSGSTEGQSLKDQLVGQRELSVIITVVVSSLLSVHAFISAWMDQRKIVVEFSKAKVDLKRIYYGIETKFFGNASGGAIGFEGQADGHTLSDEFLNELSDATVRSQRIVDLETNRFYELKAQPSFDITAIWKRSAAGAKTALNLFKSSKFDPEKLEKEVLTLEEKATEAKTEIKDKEDYLATTELKLKQNRQKLEKISMKMDEIEHIQSTNGSLTDKQAELYATYEDQFRTLDEATDELEEEYERVVLQAKLLQNELDAIEGRL